MMAMTDTMIHGAVCSGRTT